MKKIATLLTVSFLAFNVQAAEVPASIPHISDSIKHLAEIRGELLKEMKDAKDEAAMLEAAKHILDIDEAIVTLHAVEHLHSEAAKLK
jgi:hypothetical protein